MNDSQKCEVVRIKLELLEIEMDNKDVDEYMRIRSVLPGPAIEWPRHHVDGSMQCLPKGTIPHDEYEKTLNDLVEGIKEAELIVKTLESAIEQFKTLHANSKKLMKFGNPREEMIFDLRLDQQIQGLNWKEHVLRPAVLKNQLYVHLTKYRPIDAKAFFEKLDALIEERMTLFVEIMRDDVKAINDKYDASKVSHM